MSYIFVSYSREDREFVDALCGALTRANYRVWLDRQEPAPGFVDDRIRRAIEHSAACLAVLSPNSVSAAWPVGEWYQAIEWRKPMVPVLYQRCQIPICMRGYQIFDFTAYPPLPTQAVNNLLRGLPTIVAPRVESRLVPGSQPIGEVVAYEPGQRVVRAKLTGTIRVGERICIHGPTTAVTQIVRLLYRIDGVLVPSIASADAQIPVDFPVCPGDKIYRAPLRQDLMQAR